MATRIKTVQYAFPALASLTVNALTNLTPITVYLPEGSKVFRSVVAKLSCDDIVTATGASITTRTLNLRLGAAAYTSRTNAATANNSGENVSFFWQREFTDHFTANWTGTSMTCDFQVLINQTGGTTLGLVNVCVTLEITYEYDDTSATQIKTIYYPLNCPNGALPTTATTADTIPALDTLLPEASKVYRDIFVVFQGNEHNNGGTTDHTLTLRVGTANVTTGNYEAALASDRFTRYVWSLLGSYPSTAAAQNWQPSCSVATRRHHQQAYLVVTYEYNEAATTSVFNSVMLPSQVACAGSSASLPAVMRFSIGSIEEANPVGVKAAAYLFFNPLAAVASLIVQYTDPSTGNPVNQTYTGLGNNFCGTNALMAQVSQQRVTEWTLPGPNIVNMDLRIYETDSTDRVFDICGFLILCYTSNKSSFGTSAHNHTVLLNYITPTDNAGTVVLSSDNRAIYSDSSEFYVVTAIGFRAEVFPTAAAPLPAMLKLYAGDTPSIVQGPFNLADWSMRIDPELGYFDLYCDCAAAYKRHEFDNGDFTTVDRLVITDQNVINAASLDATIGPANPRFATVTAMVTMHHIYGLLQGTLTNNSGFTSLRVRAVDSVPRYRGVDDGANVGATTYSIRVPSRTAQYEVVAIDAAGKVAVGSGFPT